MKNNKNNITENFEECLCHVLQWILSIGAVIVASIVAYYILLLGVYLFSCNSVYKYMLQFGKQYVTPYFWMTLFIGLLQLIIYLLIKGRN